MSAVCVRLSYTLTCKEVLTLHERQPQSTPQVLTCLCHGAVVTMHVWCTAVFCHGVQDDMPHPLMCIVEIPYSTAPQHTYPQHPFYSTTPTAPTATAHAVGICILDISSGVCRVGTFSTADDPARSALAVALLMADPSEAVAVRNSLAGATVTLLKRHFEIKTAAGPGFSSSGGSSGSSGGSDGGCGDRARGQVPGVSWLPTSVAGNVIGDPTGAVLEGCLSEEQLQQLRQIAAQAAVAVNTSSSSSSRQAAESAAAAVLAAVGVGVKQLERCSLLSDVLPTLEVQPLEALTAHEGVQPGVHSLQGEA